MVLGFLGFICGVSMSILHIFPKIAKSWNSPQISYNTDVLLKKQFQFLLALPTFFRE